MVGVVSLADMLAVAVEVVVKVVVDVVVAVVVVGVGVAEEKVPIPTALRIFEGESHVGTSDAKDNAEVVDGVGGPRSLRGTRNASLNAFTSLSSSEGFGGNTLYASICSYSSSSSSSSPPVWGDFVRRTCAERAYVIHQGASARAMKIYA